MTQAIRQAIPVNPSQYLNYNPLLNADLSKEIKSHQWLRYKNDILAAISLIAFTAFACLGIWYTAFFAMESLPILVGLLGVGLNITHHLFFHPYKLEGEKHAEAESFERRVDKKIVQSRSENATDRLIPIRARYDILQEESNKALKDITDIFHSVADFNDHRPNNYQAYKIAARELSLSPQKFDQYTNEVITRRASKSETVDRYLELRVQEIFLSYTAFNLNRTGSYSETGNCTRSVNRDSKDDIFFKFNRSTYGISRKELLDAHKEMASYIIAKVSIETASRPTDIFSATDWEKITNILTSLNLPDDITPKKARMLYRNLDLAPFIEQAVNSKFRKTFSDYDPHSLRTLLSRYLLTKKPLANGEIFPVGIEFTAAEVNEANLIAAEIDRANPRPAKKELLFRTNPRITEIIEAKISALPIS